MGEKLKYPSPFSFIPGHLFIFGESSAGTGSVAHIMCHRQQIIFIIDALNSSMLHV